MLPLGFSRGIRQLSSSDNMQAIILAGGIGSRLKPFTVTIPKPLVPIGDRAILEVVLEQLRFHGVTEVVMAVNHMAHLVKAFFGTGERLGLRISYSEEDQPLGTAAPLRLVERLDEHFLVLNGDVLTTLDYGELFREHCAGDRTATIATYQKEQKIDLGVIETRDGFMTDYIEKPTESFTVSMGIYAMSRRVLDHIPPDGRFDLPDLMLALRGAGVPIHCHPCLGDWLDIGRMEDYETACQLFEEQRSRYLPITGRGEKPIAYLDRRAS